MRARSAAGLEPGADAPPSSRIDKLLVANRGEIARRVFRTCRKLGIATVAVFSEPDRDAPFVREADEAVALGGASPAESYLRIDAIVDAAVRAGADALHPGYGFLAENAALARACAEAGVAFVGPSPEAIEAMGSKIEAKRRMEAAGVPVLPSWNVGDESASDLAAAAERLGLPLLAKASAGGGGRGMRVVRDAALLGDAIAAARREATAAFGDGTLFLERYVEAPRHIEVQIFGDRHGTVVSLFERECSIQRRHQKIVEESPSPVVNADLRARMGAAAVTAARELDYVGAGTVEFLLDPGGEFFFLEMNTRLQVEHPVTEMVCGLDLVELQLRVAQGDPLPAEALDPVQRGHAIEARLCAEDPQNDFLPQTGVLRRFAVLDEAVRVDAGVESGSEVSAHYDPMVAKLVVHAPDRSSAARRLAKALRNAELHGPRTNRELLVAILEHEDFAAGRTDTHFLERHSPAALCGDGAGPADDALPAAAAALAGQARRRADAGVLGGLPSGWRNNPSQPQSVTFAGARGAVEVSYEIRRDGLAVSVGGVPLGRPRLGRCLPDRVELEVDGVMRAYRVGRDGALVWVNTREGQIELRELDRFPSAAAGDAAGSLVSPLPGAVVRVLAGVGERVERGAPLVVVEAMKMEHEIVAPAAGTVASLSVAEGEQVEAGSVLAVIDEEDG